MFLLFITIDSIFVTAMADVQNLSSGQKFMIGLLVNSLIGHGGLEQALNKAVDSETAKLEDIKVRLCYLYLPVYIL